MDSHCRHILFLDGECLLCRHTSCFIHHSDNAKSIYFSHLQGKTAEMLPAKWRLLTSPEGDPGGNVVLAECLGDGQYCYWHGTNAILRCLLLTKSIMSLLWVFYYTPPFLKNLLYRQLAKNRHRLSSKIKSCPIPTQSYQDALLP